MHRHHIIPRHAGGTDDPSNIILLTIEEHAEAHRKLWEEYGRWQDHIAWKTLSGQIGKEEATLLAQKLGYQTYVSSARYSPPMLGKQHNTQTKQKISASSLCPETSPDID